MKGKGVEFQASFGCTNPPSAWQAYKSSSASRSFWIICSEVMDCPSQQNDASRQRPHTIRFQSRLRKSRLNPASLPLLYFIKLAFDAAQALMDNDPDYENYDICKTEIDSHKHHDFICCFHHSPSVFVASAERERSILAL